MHFAALTVHRQPGLPQHAFEGHDNQNAIFNIVLPTTATAHPEHRPAFLGGVTVLKIAQAARARRGDDDRTLTEPADLLAIPYAVWANRELSPMTVWVAREPGRARLAPRPTLASQSKITTSFHRRGMDPGRLNDQLMPQNATDGFAPNFDFWPHKGTAEWVAYEFPQTTTVRAATVSWFDDTGTGECRLPTSWRLLYQGSDGAWQPVRGVSDYPIRKAEPVKVTFDPVSTKALRLEVQLPPDFSAGLYEWIVE